MKEYIRTTHNFSNETRKWVYRGDRGQEKHEAWDKVDCIDVPKYSFGVHALKDAYWMSFDWIVSETIKMFIDNAAGNCHEFGEWFKTTPNAREIIAKDVQKELEMLVELDMVRVRERQI